MDQVGRVGPSEISLALFSLVVVGCVGAGESDPAVRVDAKLLALDSAGAAGGAAGGGGSATACAASDPNCDGIDSDCDGRLDEDFVPRCMFGALSLRCVEGQPLLVSCNDGIACTRDSCNAGECVNAGGCVDDGNPCTVERCDPQLGCASSPAPGVACDDGNLCTVGDVCDAAGACQPGSPPVLDDGNSCTIDSCDPALGGVVHTPDVGAACDDGSPCSTGDVCTDSGVCAGQPIGGIDDGNPCTGDSCDPLTGEIGHPRLPPGTSCSDGDDCNGAETCQGLTQFTIPVNSMQTFLRTDSGDQFMSPTILRLSEVGLGPGREIRLHTAGAYMSPADSAAYAIFSANDQLLDRGTLARVPGAVQSNAPAFVTMNTHFEQFTTDVPQDFRITTSGRTVVIPEGAQYLFIGYFDTYYRDNGGTVQLTIAALQEECVRGEPQPDMCGPEE